MGFLNVSQRFAEYRNDNSATDYASSINLIEGLMTVLTYGLFLSFGAVAIKKMVVKARSMDAAELGAKIKSIRSRGTSGGSKAPGAQAKEVELASTTNPMHQNEPDNAIVVPNV